MRILHLLNDIRELGNGIINVAIDLACLQATAGHDVAIASAGGEYEALLLHYGVKHLRLDQRRTPLNLVKAVNQYRRLVQTFQPEIVHAHMVTGIVLAKALQGGTRYRLVSTVHNEFQRSARLMGVADRVIAVSQAVADSLAQRGIPRTKLRVVPNGTLGSPRSSFSSYGETLPSVQLHHPAITTVAGMYRRKGIAELIAAFAQIAPQFPHAHLYLVGNGPDRHRFEEQAQQTLTADRIHFEGFQPQPQRYLRETDIFVLASHREPFGLVLTEAREAGCAIIASHVDGIPEALDGGKAGILVPPMDVNALAGAIADLIEDSEHLKAWRKQSQTNLEWTHVERVYQQTQDVYGELKSLDGHR